MSLFHDSLRALTRRLAEREGFELVDLVVSSGARRPVIRVFLHRPGGVSVDDCRDFSEILSTSMEVEDVMSGPFILEVSSPGMTRHLKYPADFVRHRGEQAEVLYRSGAGVEKVTGTLAGASDAMLLLAAPSGEMEIPLEAVISVKPIIDWGKIFKEGKKRGRPEENHE